MLSGAFEFGYTGLYNAYGYAWLFVLAATLFADFGADSKRVEQLWQGAFAGAHTRPRGQI